MMIAPPEEMAANARNAAAYLKTLAHEGRLMILCHLGSGEKSVGEPEPLLGTRLLGCQPDARPPA